MKNLSFLLMSAFMIMTAACSSDIDSFELEDTTPLTLDMRIIGVGLPGSDETRVQMNELDDMVWSTGDHLKVYGYVNDVCTAPAVFDLIGGEGSQTGIFSGSFGTDWQKFELSYKGSNVKYSPDIANTYPSYGYLDQIQTGMNSFAHLRDHLLLRSGKHSTDVTSDIIQLKPQCAILKININNLPDAIKDIEKFDVCFYITNPSATRIRNAKVHLSGRVMPDENNFIYMAFEPAHELKPGGELSIGFITDGKEYKAGVTSDNGKIYKSGKIYTVTADYKNPGQWKWTLP